jgi:hypothetical protein
MRSAISSLLLSALIFVGPAAYADEPGAPSGGGGGSAAPSGSAGSTGGPSGAPSLNALMTGGQGGPTPPPGMLSAGASGFKGQFMGGLLFEQINEDYFVTVDLYNSFSFGPVTLGVWVPLRMRVIDEDPDNDGIFRKEDWDEISDWTRLLRFVEVNLGGKDWRFRGRFGQLDGESIGHGTILAGYYNVVDRNHYQAGLALSGAIKYGGVEFMLDNIVDPEIFGFRFHVRPTSFFTDNKWANRFAMGFSFIADAKAPEAIAREPIPGAAFIGQVIGGNVVAKNDRPVVDSENNYVFASTTMLPVIGLDIEYTLIQSKMIDLVPYMDLNFIADEETGVGFHMGVFFNMRLPLSIKLLSRLEYRWVGDGYAPRYIDSTYEAQRRLFSSTDANGNPTTNPLTKLAWLRSADKGQNGWLGELYFDFAGWVRVGGTYEDYTGPDNASLTLSLLVPALKVIQVGAYYSNRGFNSITEAFDLETAIAVAYVRYKAYGPLYITAQWTRTWQIDANDADRYEAQDDFSVGLGVGFSY